MDSLKIGTFNAKDGITNRNGGLRSDGTNNADLVANIVKENEFDLLGTQELTVRYVNELSLRLTNYKLYGNYRYGNILKTMPYNESNLIVTNRNILKSETVWLPWIASNFSDFKTSIARMSIMPRIATIVILEVDRHKKVCMINTHLDYEVPSIQVKQLNAIKNLILKYAQKYDIVLTGDFNMELDNQRFHSFVNDVKDKIKHIDIKSSTWHGKNGEETTIDHIFVPKNWKVEDAGKIDSMGTSDHDLAFVNVKVR